MKQVLASISDPSPQDICVNLLQQLQQYLTNDVPLTEEYKGGDDKVRIKAYWTKYKSTTPEIYALAMRILNMCSTAAPVERANSTAGWLHSKLFTRRSAATVEIRLCLRLFYVNHPGEALPHELAQNFLQSRAKNERHRKQSRQLTIIEEK